MDTSQGIFNAVNHALTALGCPRDTDPTRLSRMIGPPVEEGFPEVYGVDGEAATVLFRQYYRARGVKEYVPYVGMEALLRRLKAAGVGVAVATMKPEVFARAILAELGWADCFDVVAGVSLDAPPPAKATLIAQVLAQTGAAPADAVMVGDRTSDITAGRAAGVGTIFCRYGFGARGEAENSGADAIADTVTGLEELLLRSPR